MISAKENITGSINSKQTITGVLNKAIEYVNPITQEKEVTPTKEVQVVEPDGGYTGLSKVIVNRYTPNVIKKTITSNGIYKACDDEADGYSEVDVVTAGVDINEYFKDTVDGGEQMIGGKNWSGTVKKIPAFKFNGTDMIGMFMNFGGTEIDLSNIDTSKVTNMSNSFCGCANVASLDLSNFDTSKVTNMYGMFQGCKNLIGKLDLSNFDTSNVTRMGNMFRDVGNKVTELDISNFDMSKVTDVQYVFNGLISVEKLKINNHHNLGKAYKTTDNANYFYYTLDLSKLTKISHDDIMNVINGLFDIASAGVKPQKLVLGSTNLTKLTSEEKEIATNKGWTVS